ISLKVKGALISSSGGPSVSGRCSSFCWGSSVTSCGPWRSCGWESREVVLPADSVLQEPTVIVSDLSTGNEQDEGRRIDARLHRVLDLRSPAPSHGWR